MSEKPESRLSAGERAYRTLRARIVSLEPNASIGEQMLAESLGVSRTPVREALARLATEGLVDARSRSGGIVSPIRREAVESAQFVREALETAVIDKAVRGRDARTLFRFRQSLEAQRFAIVEQDTALFYDADEHMHSLFCRLAGQAKVWDVIADAKRHMDRVRRISIDNTDLGTLVDDHDELYRCVEGGDRNGARKVLRRHLRRVLVDLEFLEARFPHYFSEVSPRAAVRASRRSEGRNRK